MYNTPQPPQQLAQRAPTQPSPPQKRSRIFKFFATTGSLLAALAAIVAILQFLGITNIEALLQHPTPAPNNSPTPNNPKLVSRYIQLKSSYSGNAHGYQNASLQFSNVSQDPQGNVSLVLLFTLTDGNKQATYSCHGKFTGNQSIALQCTQIDAQDFRLSINISILSSDLMQGTLEATSSTDPTYDHLYSWSADSSSS